MKSITKAALFTSILFLSISVFGQKGYEKISEVDGVIIYGKMKPSKFLKKDSPLKLMLKAHNTNAYAVSCTMKVSFFDTGISKEESEPIEVCIKSNKKVKGRKNGMQLLSENSTNEDMKNDSSAYEVYEAAVTKVEKCD